MDPKIELPKDGGYSQESVLPIEGTFVRDSTIDPYPSITQEQNVENTSLETLPSLYSGKNIYDKAGENSSSIEVSWCEKGLTLSDLGQFEDALESYKRALEINPRSLKPSRIERMYSTE